MTRNIAGMPPSLVDVTGRVTVLARRAAEQVGVLRLQHPSAEGTFESRHQDRVELGEFDHRSGCQMVAVEGEKGCRGVGVRQHDQQPLRGTGSVKVNPLRDGLDELVPQAWWHTTDGLQTVSGRTRAQELIELVSLVPNVLLVSGGRDHPGVGRARWA